MVWACTRLPKVTEGKQKGLNREENETANFKKFAASLGQPIEARTKGPRVSSIKRGGWNKIIKPASCSGKSENARWSKRGVRRPRKAGNARGELERDVASARVNWGKDGFRLYYDDS